MRAFNLFYEKQRYVFICRHGEARSFIAAATAKEVIAKRGLNIDVDYFGTEKKTVPEAILALEDADSVFAMDSSIAEVVRKQYQYKRPIITLNIKDIADKGRLEEIIHNQIGLLFEYIPLS